MNTTFGCPTTDPVCLKSFVVPFYIRNLSMMGESQFIKTTGCLPPCSLNRYKFEAPVIAQVPLLEGADPEYKMVG